MTFPLRLALTALSFSLLLPAAAQTGTGRWGWATAPFTAGDSQSPVAQTLDPARHRLYVLTRFVAPQQLGSVTVPAGFALHTFDATNGQCLEGTSLMLANEGELTYCNLTLDAPSGEILLTGQYTGILHVGAQTLNTTARNGFVARYSPGTSQWRWATQVAAASTISAVESAVVLPGGDVVAAGSYIGDSLQVGPSLLRSGTAPDSWISTGFMGRLDGATGQWQWTQLGSGRDLNLRNLFFALNGPGEMHKLALDAANDQLLLLGLTDTTATFGSLPTLPAGLYLARLDPTTGQWLRATTLPTLEGVNQIATDPYGNTYLAGTHMDRPEALFTAKLNAADQLQWRTQEANPYNGAFGGGPMWESACDLAVDSWGNVFVSAGADFFMFCGSGPGGGYRVPSYPARVYNFDAASGTRKWRLESTESYANAFQIDADDQGNAYVMGSYSIGGLSFSATALHPVTNSESHLFLAELTDPVTISRVLAAPRDHPADRAFKVWPNPAHETVQLLGTTAPTATLLDAVGRVVRSAAVVPGQTQIDLTGLAPGVYSLRCGTAVRRLVIE